MLDVFTDDYPHCRDAYIYACHVTKGHKEAGKFEVLACQRFLDDCERIESIPWDFDIGLAERACRFIECLPHTKGRWAKKHELITLGAWQCFIVVNIFGWVDSRGLRRFREVYFKVARKNGKSLLAAAIGLYMFLADGEYGGEVYSGATTLDQALEVFTPARLICLRMEELKRDFGIEVNIRNLNTPADGSKFEPVIGTPGDGPSPSCSIVDEWHEHKTSAMVDTMETGMAAREQPLLLQITTSGDDISGPCYRAELDYKKLLDGVFSDDRVFVVIYECENPDEWTELKAIEQANPNLGVSVDREELLRRQEEAIRKPRKQNAFKRKNLNIWVGASTAWVNMQEWQACGDKTLSESNLSALDSLISLDLASKKDICAKLRCYSEIIDTRRHYYFFPRFFAPAKTVEIKENDHYQQWVNAGELVKVDGAEIDFNEIQLEIEEDFSEISAIELVYDPWRASQLAQGVAKKGATVVEFRNTVPMMAPAMREFEAALSAGRIHHPNNSLLNWMASNLVSRTDKKDNPYPIKETDENKIDGMIAIIMGIGRFMTMEPPEELDILFL